MAKNDGFLRFLNFIGKLIDDRIEYKNLKSNPEERPKTTSFGKSAIIYSIFFLALASLGALLFINAVSGKWLFVISVFAAILGIAFLVYSIPLLILGISHTVKQLILNRRAISWIALSILIVCIGAVFTIVALIVSAL